MGKKSRIRKPNFVRVEPQVFLMGNENSTPGDPDALHPVEITRAYEIADVPVTQKFWRDVVTNDPIAKETLPHSPSRHKGNNHPVERISWFDALEFCNALSRSEGLDEAYEITRDTDGTITQVIWKYDSPGYRLPTEAEWELAARAGKLPEEASFTEEDIDAMAWHSGNSGGTTQEVATKRPNDWGLYDMLGNVWEWCWDAMGPYGPAAVDPIGPDEITYR